MNAIAYIIGVCATVVMLLISMLVANLISYRPDNGDIKTRKIWFWILGAITPVVSFLVSFFFVYLDIKGHAKQESFMTAMVIATISSFVLYVVLGIVLSKVKKHGKMGNWF